MNSLMTILMIVPLLVIGQSTSPKGAIVGVWRGISICTNVPGNESCHDEKVIYEFRSKSSRADEVTLKADKVVNGAVVPMGELECTYDSTENRWIAEFQNSRVHILWTYVVNGTTITGTCVDLPSRVVRRNVSVRKDRVIAPKASGLHPDDK
jgi:hypothetical protein